MNYLISAASCLILTTMVICGQEESKVKQEVIHETPLWKLKIRYWVTGWHPRAFPFYDSEFERISIKSGERKIVYSDKSNRDLWRAVTVMDNGTVVLSIRHTEFVFCNGDGEPEYRRLGSIEHPFRYLYADHTCMLLQPYNLNMIEPVYYVPIENSVVDVNKKRFIRFLPVNTSPEIARKQSTLYFLWNLPSDESTRLYSYDLTTKTSTEIQPGGPSENLKPKGWPFKDDSSIEAQKKTEQKD